MRPTAPLFLRFFAALLGVSSLLLPSARAAIVRPIDVEGLARRADLIVRGQAGAGESAWSGDRHLIRTTTRVRVRSLLKGQGEKEVEITTPGGSVGDLAQKVVGAPELAPGEEVILFLKAVPGRKRLYAIDGFGQGKFNVIPGRDGKGTAVVRRAPDLKLLGPDGRLRDAAMPKAVSEEAFVQRIRRALQKGSP